MSKEKAKITKISITIAGKEITCTPEQIKELKEALEAMYPTPKEIVREYHHDWYRHVPRPYWYEPKITRWESKIGNGIMLCAS
jgi:hypothetical protein